MVVEKDRPGAMVGGVPCLRMDSWQKIIQCNDFEDFSSVYQMPAVPSNALSNSVPCVERHAETDQKVAPKQVKGNQNNQGEEGGCVGLACLLCFALLCSALLCFPLLCRLTLRCILRPVLAALANVCFKTNRRGKT